MVGFNDLKTKFPEMPKRQMVGIQQILLQHQIRKRTGNAKKVINILLWLQNAPVEEDAQYAP